MHLDSTTHACAHLCDPLEVLNPKLQPHHGALRLYKETGGQTEVFKQTDRQTDRQTEAAWRCMLSVLNAHRLSDTVTDAQLCDG